MNLRPKTVRRLLLLSLVSVLLIGGIFSLFVVRQWQNQRLLELHRTEGLAAFKEGDYFNTLEKGSFYLRRGRQDDPEVLYAMAESRRLLDEPDGRHLVLAIPLYRLYMQQRPEDDDVRRTLLSVYNDAGYFVEARDLALTLRPQDLSEAGPEHVQVLREEALALLGAQEFGERLESVLGRIFELDPLDVYGQMVQLELFRNTDRREDARRWGDRILEEFPDDPRGAMVYGASRLIHPSTDELAVAKRRLCEAAGRDPVTAEPIRPAQYASAEHVRHLVALLDRVGAFEHSLAVLREAAAEFDDQHLHRMLVRRLWQEGAYEEVLQLTEHLDPADREADSQRLGVRALSLASLGRGEESLRIAAVLEDREGDFRAEGWSAAIPLVVDPDREGHIKAVSRLREAARVHSIEPIIHVMLGDHLEALGRLEEARTVWTDAGRMMAAASWPVPWVKLAESLLREGRTDEALAAAEEAMRIAPNRIAVNIVWFETQAMRIQKGGTGGVRPQAVLERLERAAAQLAEHPESEAIRDLQERLLTNRIILLSRAGRQAEAQQVAQAAVQAEPPLRREVLQRLAAISVAEGLGIDEMITARVQSVESGGAAVLQARAHRLAADGRVAEGRELLERAAGANPDLESQIALARYLDTVGDPDALAAWRRIGEENPDNLMAQRACLLAQAAAADGEFVERTIKRYQSLQGKEFESEDAVARLARARVLLQGRPTRRMRDEAVGILAAVVSSNPQLVEARMLLASALAMSDPGRQITPDLSRAVMHLTEAARLEPHNAAVALELARLQQVQGERQQAHRQLLRIARDSRLGTIARQRAAEMLLQAGDAVAAREVLAELVERDGEEGSSRLLGLLAQAHSALGQTDQAGALYQRIMGLAHIDPDTAVVAAVHFARSDELELARQLIARLDEIDLQPHERDYAAAQFEAYAGDPERAAELFERSLSEHPGQARVWRHYAAMYMRLGDAAKAAAVAERGRDEAPHDTALGVLHAQARLMADGEADPSLTPLIEALRPDQGFAQLTRMLSAIEAARQRGELQTVEGLTRLGAQFPTSQALQMYIAQRLARLDPAAAAAAAQRAMNIDAGDPEPARLATDMFRSLGRWNDALSAAQAWRQRDRTGSMQPDVAIAEAYLNVGRTQRALQVLSSHLSKALSTPDEADALSVLNMQARILVRAGRHRDAWEFLMPLLAESQDVRRLIWIDIAARDLDSLDESRRWLGKVQAHVPDDAKEERLSAAVALTMLAERFTDRSDELLHDALAQLEDLVASPDLASAAGWEALGVVRTRLGDMAKAEEAYLRALELDGRRAVALNNLAIITAQSRGDLEEAAALSARAVAATQPPQEGHVSTLAAIHRELADQRLRQGDRKGARASYRDAAGAYQRLSALRPADAGPLIQAAQSLWRAGDAIAAADLYERVLRVHAMPPEVESAVRNNLAAALRIGSQDEADLERAHVAVYEALRIVERPEYFATLGWIEIDRGDLEAASQAFRRASELAGGVQELPAAALGLAWLSTRGEEPDHRKARELMEGLRESPGEEYEERLREVREAVEGLALR